MFLIWGDSEDPPIARVRAELQRRGHALVAVDSDLGAFEYDLTIDRGATGRLRWRGRGVAVEELRGLYVRPGRSASAWTARAAALSALASTIAAPVVNRPTAGRSNWSKPYQLQLLAQSGFAVPETLVTTDPATALAFVQRHGRVVYKSVSGVRSVVGVIERGDAHRLQGVRSGPVQLQRWIDGTDVRVHVVGERWFACAVESDAVDYRYPRGMEVAGKPIDIPAPIGRQLVAFTRAQGLLVSGADLRVSPTGCWYTFEVNPSPGFTFYEDLTGQPIAAAIVDLLEAGSQSDGARALQPAARVRRSTAASMCLDDGSSRTVG